MADDVAIRAAGKLSSSTGHVCPCGRGGIAGEHLGIYEGEAVLIARPGDLLVKQFRSGVFGVALGKVLLLWIPKELGQAVVGDLHPAVVEHQAARIESQMLNAVLLVKVIEHLGCGADVIDEFTAANTRQLLSLTLYAVVLANGLFDPVGEQHQAACLEENDLARNQGGMMQRLKGEQLAFQFGTGPAQAIDQLHHSFETVRAEDAPRRAACCGLLTPEDKSP